MGIYNRELVFATHIVSLRDTVKQTHHHFATDILCLRHIIIIHHSPRPRRDAFKEINLTFLLPILCAYGTLLPFSIHHSLLTIHHYWSSRTTTEKGGNVT